jgi:hypothetical protein
MGKNITNTVNFIPTGQILFEISMNKLNIENYTQSRAIPLETLDKSTSKTPFAQIHMLTNMP